MKHGGNYRKMAFLLFIVQQMKGIIFANLNLLHIDFYAFTLNPERDVYKPL